MIKKLKKDTRPKASDGSPFLILSRHSSSRVSSCGIALPPSTSYRARSPFDFNRNLSKTRYILFDHELSDFFVDCELFVLGSVLRYPEIVRSIFDQKQQIFHLGMLKRLALIAFVAVVVEFGGNQISCSRLNSGGYIEMQVLLITYGYRLFVPLFTHDGELVVDPNVDMCLYLQTSKARLFKEYKEGPSETPFEGGVFQLAFAIPEQYPLQPPQVRFLSKIFHPNVHFKTGEICLDILKNAWSPAWTLQSVCRAIIALMAHPEPDSPLNCNSGSSLAHVATELLEPSLMGIRLLERLTVRYHV
ncbi:hypothetical protein EUGRSUZ_L01100 [Eucalyptus grandis]|uniref:UBC core domain-containing protein n=1 Tax=Eucalyptus grandis TaxID=71139 RepID=A0A058ZTX2_EUCGR|nr:hypothetical protein EUGRSUZ_L01100 [Eucalyptus grandis]